MLKAKEAFVDAEEVTRPKSILIEGWRGINHSFALVNQYQILELLRFGGLKLFHSDVPFAFPHWNRGTNGSGLSAEDQQLVDALQAPVDDDIDCVYRICSPFRVGAEADRRRTVSFMVTELGPSTANFENTRNTESFYTRGDNVITTPSHWSRERFVDWGFSRDKIKVIPHGVDCATFNPLTALERQTNRQGLGIFDDEVVFLNIGLSTWNKGVDLLLLAFAKLRSDCRKVRLILKDQADVYGLSVEKAIEDLGRAHPELSRADTRGAISVVSTNMSTHQLRLLYGIADCYVSPYRAEGFNLPVLESIACGTPVIVTRGGATDDFCTDDVAVRIGGVEGRHEDLATRFRGRFIEPNLSELIAAMDCFARGDRSILPHFEAKRGLVTDRFSWRNAAIQLARLTVGHEADTKPEAKPVAVKVELQAVGQKDVLDLLALIRPMSMARMKKIRIGNNYDGGYVLPAIATECDAVLSIGVGPDVSFDMELAKRGAKIAQFDHTVDKPPTNHENFSFYKLGWGVETRGDLLSFDDILKKFSLLSPRRALFKFDIEGFEYGVLDAIDANHLRAFDVIVCEFHDFNKLADLAFYKTALVCFEKLTRFHAPIHLHANNYATVSLVLGVPIPNVIEISFLRRDLDSFPGRCFDPIPGPLDKPNHPYRADICMNPF